MRVRRVSNSVLASVLTIGIMFLIVVVHYQPAGGTPGLSLSGSVFGNENTVWTNYACDPNSTIIHGEMFTAPSSGTLDSISAYLSSGGYDPTFGYTTGGGSWDDLGPYADQETRGSVFTNTNTNNGYVNYIMAYVASNGGGKFEAAIYKNSDNTLVGYSDMTWVDDTGGSGTWVELDFTGNTYIYGNTSYVLCITAYQQDIEMDYIAYDSGTSNQGRTGGASWGSPSSVTWDSPASFGNNNNKYSLYCVYTVNNNPPVLPGKPTLVSPANGAVLTDNKPTFTWNGGQYADNHYIQVNYDNNWSLDILDNNTKPVTDNTWTKTSPGYKNETYYWRVWAHNTTGDNVSASVWSFTIAAPPMQPTLLSPSNNSSISANTPVTFNWARGYQADNDRIETSTVSNFSTTVDNFTVAPSTSYTEMYDYVNTTSSTWSTTWIDMADTDPDYHFGNGFDWQSTYSGTLHVQINFANTVGGQNAYLRFYKNHYPYGAIWTTTGYNWTTITENLAGWSVGDNLETYVRVDNPNSLTVVRNLHIYSIDYNDNTWTNSAGYSAGTYYWRVVAHNSSRENVSGAWSLISGTPPDFSISVSPTSGTINRGGSTTATVTVTSINGYSTDVNMSTSSLPAGVTLSFNPTHGTPTFTSTMTVSAALSTVPNTYSITIYGGSKSCGYTLTIVNRPPDTPSTPSGPQSCLTNGYSYTYSTSTTDPDGDSVRYRFDWGDGNISDWTGWVSSGSSASALHSWSSSGIYQVKAQAEDSNYATSGWSDSLRVLADDDRNPTEVGVWAVGDLPWGSLTNAVPDAQGFYDVLVGQGYTGRFTLYNQANVNEAQFQDPTKANSSGEDYAYTDSCDFIWFTDHGDPATLYTGYTGVYPFGYPHYVDLTDSVRWGDVDMEWAFFHACDVLDTSVCLPNGGKIAGAFDDRLHGMCGYSTISYIGPYEGSTFAKYATGLESGCPGPHSIGDSWVFSSKTQEHRDDVWGAWLSGSTMDYNTVFADKDYLPGFGSGMLPDPNYSNGNWCLLYYTWACDWP